jgi:purine-nucleoside phosphorylase
MIDSTLDAARRTLVSHGIEGPFACALVLGTGLGHFADDHIEDPIIVPYADVPGFPPSLVSGHSGRVVCGRVGRRKILIFQGRSHYYEAGEAAAMRVPIGVLASFGSPPLVLTNAAGSVKAGLRPGSLVAISDHINLTGRNPLIGEAGDGRFVSMTDAYDPRLRHTLKQAALEAGIALDEGVYLWFSGPSFETPAEIRMARLVGADLVGMSTVPEAILARRFGLSVAAVSIVTNLAAGVEGASPSHDETKAVAAGAAASLGRILLGFMGMLDHG